MKAIRLKTEYLTNPMGIDTVAPRLFWNCEGGITQTAWQIMAQVNGQTVWDSQKTASSSMHVTVPAQLYAHQNTDGGYKSPCPLVITLLMRIRSKYILDCATVLSMPR